MLEKLVFLCQTFGSEALATRGHVQQLILCLTGFAACIHSVQYGQGKQVTIGTVSGALSAVGTGVALAYEGNHTKAQGEKSLVPRLAQTMEGCRKEDPSTKKNCQW